MSWNDIFVRRHRTTLHLDRRRCYAAGPNPRQIVAVTVEVTIGTPVPAPTPTPTGMAI